MIMGYYKEIKNYVFLLYKKYKIMIDSSRPGQNPLFFFFLHSRALLSNWISYGSETELRSTVMKKKSSVSLVNFKCSTNTDTRKRTLIAIQNDRI